MAWLVYILLVALSVCVGLFGAVALIVQAGVAGLVAGVFGVVVIVFGALAAAKLRRRMLRDSRDRMLRDSHDRLPGAEP
jgi:hypothetical protein